MCSVINSKAIWAPPAQISYIVCYIVCWWIARKASKIETRPTVSFNWADTFRFAEFMTSGIVIEPGTGSGIGIGIRIGSVIAASGFWLHTDSDIFAQFTDVYGIRGFPFRFLHKSRLCKYLIGIFFATSAFLFFCLAVYFFAWVTATVTITGFPSRFRLASESESESAFESKSAYVLAAVFGFRFR